MTLPPGPREPVLLQIIRWSQQPLTFHEQCQRRFGDVFTMRLGAVGDYVCVNHPAHVKQVFTADPDVLLTGPANTLIEPIVGATSIFRLDGDAHLRQRRLLMAPFRGERMHAYSEVIRDITDASLDRWPIGEPFSVQPFMQEVTRSIIMRTVFGLAEGTAMQRLDAMLAEFFKPPPGIFTFLPFLQKDLPLSPYRRFLRLRDRVRAELEAIIAERRSARDTTDRSDILSLLMNARYEDGQAMTDEELRDALVTMITAGHDTTASTLAWAFERILATPEVHERLREEVRGHMTGGAFDPEKLPLLEYTDAVIKETLRMRPVLPLTARFVQKPYQVAGIDLPVGCFVAVCIYLTHHRPDIYPEPERFLPERFIGRRLDPYEWMPFGGGTRRCLGMAFALHEVKLALATVMARAELRLGMPTPAGAVRRSVTIAPDRGTLLVLDARAPRAGVRGASAVA